MSEEQLLGIETNLADSLTQEEIDDVVAFCKEREWVVSPISTLIDPWVQCHCDCFVDKACVAGCWLTGNAGRRRPYRLCAVCRARARPIGAYS